MRRTEVLSFTYPYAAVPKGRPRFSVRGGAIHSFTPKKTREAERSIAVFAAAAMNQRGVGRVEDGAVALDIRFFFRPPSSWRSGARHKAALCGTPKITRADLDNCVKLVSDALNGLVYDDDARIALLTAQKLYDYSDRIEISVSRLEA